MAPRIPRQERFPRRYTPNAADVFCLCKHDLCDDELSQPALLVWPGDEKSKVEEFWQSAAQHKGQHFNVDEERAKDLLELADALTLYPQYGRAIDYMKNLAGSKTQRRHDAFPLPWISSGGRPVNPVVRELPPREARPIPHKLQVRFHRP